MRKELEKLISIDREINLLNHIGALLGWDQETYMPPKAITERSEQLALVESLVHERFTRPEIAELLAALGSTEKNPRGQEDLSALERAFLREFREEYDRRTKLSARLVAEIARATSLAQQVWIQARQDNDFDAFAPHLGTIVSLMREKAECLSEGCTYYDSLLNLFEPGITEASLRRIFDTLKTELVELLAAIRPRPAVAADFLSRPCPAERQKAINEWLLELLPYDRTRGRLDTVAHPFTTTLGSDDVRITTRYIEDNFVSGIFSTIHETGHALYELGIDPGKEYALTCLSEASSMGIHESQSRLWENIIGRSRALWKNNYHRLAELAGPTLEGVSLDDFIRGINKVEASLIRTEADEVTYCLHVILRFELESALINGQLEVRDIPAAWNERMKKYLGIEPPDDSRGCLQDVHWSAGLFGYFPSYALGNLYAAQFWDAMKAEIPDLEQRIESGDLVTPLDWLRKKVHIHGAVFRPEELVVRATGTELDPGHFIGYLRGKYSRLYGF